MITLQKCGLYRKDLIRMKLPEKSIVVIYKFEFPIDIACVWVACTNVDLIPYIIENDSLPSASDINYKAVISTSLSVSIEGTESSTLSDKFYIHIKRTAPSSQGMATVC